jgi:hypothetical protein
MRAITWIVFGFVTVCNGSQAAEYHQGISFALSPMAGGALLLKVSNASKFEVTLENGTLSSTATPTCRHAIPDMRLRIGETREERLPRGCYRQLSTANQWQVTFVSQTVFTAQTKGIHPQGYDESVMSLDQPLANNTIDVNFTLVRNGHQYAVNARWLQVVRTK